jgi:hypothetical protein
MQTSEPWVGFETMAPEFEEAQTDDALDRMATVTVITEIWHLELFSLNSLTLSFTKMLITVVLIKTESSFLY